MKITGVMVTNITTLLDLEGEQPNSHFKHSPNAPAQRNRKVESNFQNITDTSLLRICLW